MHSRRAEVERRARELGASLRVITRPRLDVTIDAPQGMVWQATDSHALIQAMDGGMTEGQVWETLYERMGEGLRVCAQRACAVCGGNAH